MKPQSFKWSFDTKLSVLVVGFTLMTTGCQQADSGSPVTDFLFSAVSVAGDFIRALLAAFLF